MYSDRNDERCGLYLVSRKSTVAFSCLLAFSVGDDTCIRFSFDCKHQVKRKITTPYYKERQTYGIVTLGCCTTEGRKSSHLRRQEYILAGAAFDSNVKQVGEKVLFFS